MVDENLKKIEVHKLYGVWIMRSLILSKVAKYGEALFL